VNRGSYGTRGSHRYANARQPLGYSPGFGCDLKIATHDMPAIAAGLRQFPTKFAPIRSDQRDGVQAYTRKSTEENWSRSSTPYAQAARRALLLPLKAMKAWPKPASASNATASVEAGDRIDSPGLGRGGPGRAALGPGDRMSMLTLRGESGKVISLAFNPDGKTPPRAVKRLFDAQR
jgi:hypothetical protein